MVTNCTFFCHSHCFWSVCFNAILCTLVEKSLTPSFAYRGLKNSSELVEAFPLVSHKTVLVWILFSLSALSTSGSYCSPFGMALLLGSMFAHTSNHYKFWSELVRFVTGNCIMP